MGKIKNKIFALSLAVAFLGFGCQTAQKAETNAAKPADAPKIVTAPKVETAQTFPIVDLQRLAKKTPAEFEKTFGQATETKPVKDPNPGEYRVYKIPNHEKGLAVRFYGNQAKSFNLILSAPFASSKEALQKSFGVDVGNLPPKIEKQEPLSENWSGTFGGIKFSKIYAKKQRPETKEFIFVLAEIE